MKMGGVLYVCGARLIGTGLNSSTVLAQNQ
jgi:hypothetical protein